MPEEEMLQPIDVEVKNIDEEARDVAEQETALLPIEDGKTDAPDTERPV